MYYPAARLVTAPKTSIQRMQFTSKLKACSTRIAWCFLIILWVVLGAVRAVATSLVWLAVTLALGGLAVVAWAILLVPARNRCEAEVIAVGDDSLYTWIGSEPSVRNLQVVS